MIKIKTNRESKLGQFRQDLESSVQQNLAKAGVFLEGEMVMKIQSGLTPPLKEATVKRKGSDTPLFDSGELLDQISHDLSGDTVEVGVFGSRAQIAKYHEFGAPKAGIPERSFMRSAFNENKKKIKKIMSGK
ncbi:HK97-gp10 family putative phage morphogenesis protein [Methanococcoides sp. AM1]|uniref:HK97-gp10 family putative phage morphogenesis protein n=1 Tax=Methanococcoides sp. AM1 TaxID=1201011 RepID=UPI001082EDFE|nr:HK97-gp10 family putative phage morphogenesis protein [Methanococcoides sp. AM1]